MKTMFNISSYSMDELSIVATIEESKQLVMIVRDDFENFLINNDKLDTQFDYSDGEGEHRQILSRMTLDEYWDSHITFIKRDLHDYIIYKKLDWGKTFSGLFEMFNAITEDYAKKVGRKAGIFFFSLFLMSCTTLKHSGTYTVKSVANDSLVTFSGVKGTYVAYGLKKGQRVKLNATKVITKVNVKPL